MELEPIGRADHRWPASSGDELDGAAGPIHEQASGLRLLDVAARLALRVGPPSRGVAEMREALLEPCVLRASRRRARARNHERSHAYLGSHAFFRAAAILRHCVASKAVLN